MKQQQSDCPLQLSGCFRGCCRYFLKYEQRCAYEQIKALERQQQRKAEEGQGPGRRVSDSRKVEMVRMKD